jgi:outer membrane protein assembly factor BamD (BamD/ComL family)
VDVPLGAEAINETLLTTRSSLTPASMLAPDPAQSREQMLKDANLRLEIGRKQRAAKQFIPARANFAAIMSHDVPENLWQSAMLELAQVAQDENDLPQAVQVYNQYLARWPQDVNVPEVLLRQGLLFRQMGMPKMSLGKLYAVMTSALVLKASDTSYYQRLVLQAQTEIAETYLEAGQYKEARESLVRLLKLDTTHLNRAQVQFKLVRCLAELKDWAELVPRAREFLERNP